MRAGLPSWDTITEAFASVKVTGRVQSVVENLDSQSKELARHFLPVTAKIDDITTVDSRGKMRVINNGCCRGRLPWLAAIQVLAKDNDFAAVA